MSPRGEWTAEPCRNCGDGTPGRYCPNCGQRKDDVRVSLRRMLGEVLEDQLSIDATLPRTLVALLFRPGHLTNEYLKGRIASWVPPFRLYLASSVLFFLALSVNTRVGEVRRAVTGTGADTSGTPTVADAVDAVRQLQDSLSSTAGAAAPADTSAGPGGAAMPDSAAAPEAGNPTRAVGVTIEPGEPGDTTPLTDRVVVRTGYPSIDSVLASRLRALGGLPADEAASRIFAGMIERVPTAMFVLVPVFAALLALLYLFRRRYYVEHFVFALHYHAFAFLGFLILMIGWTPLRMVLGLWMGVYLWLAMRKVYGQGWFLTTLKWTAVNVVYFVVLITGLMTTAVVAVLLL